MPSCATRRPASLGRRRPGDIAILFRSRTSHREFEHELETRAIPTYVYKGLGFFDSDEIKDACALIRYLASPSSDLRAAALLRSGIARISDAALAALAPSIAAAITDGPPAGVGSTRRTPACFGTCRRSCRPTNLQDSSALVFATLRPR